MRTKPPGSGRWIAAALAAMVFAAGVPPAAAQAGAPSTAAETAPSERARRDADKVFQWIRLQADKPRRVEAQVAAPARVVARRAEAPVAEAPAAASRVAAAPAAAVAGERVAEALEPAAAAVARAAPGNATSVAPAASLPAVEAAMPQPAPMEFSGELALTLVREVQPEYSDRLMRKLRHGSVTVRFAVQPDGSVAQVEVTKSDHVGLNAAAVAAVEQWRFMPINQAQVAMTELSFNLD